MPHRQEKKGYDLTDCSVSHEFETLVNIGSHPMICVQIEALDDITKLGRSLQFLDLHVSTALPIHKAVFMDPVEGEAGSDTHTLREKPGEQVLSEDDSAPEGEQQQPVEDTQRGEPVWSRPVVRQEDWSNDMDDHVEGAQGESVHGVGDRGAGEAGGEIRPHEVPVLLHGELRAYEVAAKKEAVREHLEETGWLPEGWLQLVLGEKLLPLEPGPLPVVAVEGQSYEPEGEDTVGHGPADVVARGLGEVVAHQEVAEVEDEGEDNRGEGAPSQGQDDVGGEYRVNGMEKGPAKHPNGGNKTCEEEVKVLLCSWPIC